ncbi:hypothetical protein BH20CHL7_BH20CHL7_12170 [soil metagenome]
MTTPDDHIKVPTNGHHRAATQRTTTQRTKSQPTKIQPTKIQPTASDPRIAVSPAQAAAGFGIIAALILLLVRGRRRGSGDRG